MEDNKQAKITISIEEGRFEISGSELFVTQQIENWGAIILYYEPTNERITNY